jgi:hypothetical protein
MPTQGSCVLWCGVVVAGRPSCVLRAAPRVSFSARSLPAGHSLPNCFQQRLTNKQTRSQPVPSCAALMSLLARSAKRAVALAARAARAAAPQPLFTAAPRVGTTTAAAEQRRQHGEPRRHSHTHRQGAIVLSVVMCPRRCWQEAPSRRSFGFLCPPLPLLFPSVGARGQAQRSAPSWQTMEQRADVSIRVAAHVLRSVYDVCHSSVRCMCRAPHVRPDWCNIASIPVIPSMHSGNSRPAMRTR